MAIVRVSAKEAREGRGRVNKAALDATTEADIERHMLEDDSDTSKMGEPYFVPRRVDLRVLRKRLGLSQMQFAKRYFIPLRSIQQWEQEEREPSEAARVLLYAIENDPEGIEKALHPQHRKKAS